MAHAALTLFFRELTNDKVALVGGKNASLGEMFNKLSDQGISVPNGFATTAAAYWLFLDENGLRTPLTELLETLDTKEFANLPTASFAGQHDSFLNVQGEQAVIEACQRCYESLFNDRAIKYRVTNGFDHMQVALSAGVQTMVHSNLASAGVAFTIEPETGHDQFIYLTGSWGLGAGRKRSAGRGESRRVLSLQAVAARRPPRAGSQKTGRQGQDHALRPAHRRGPKLPGE